MTRSSNFKMEMAKARQPAAVEPVEPVIQKKNSPLQFILLLALLAAMVTCGYKFVIMRG